MQTTDNKQIGNTWQEVTTLASTIQLLSGSCRVSYGTQPTTNRAGYLLQLGDNDSIINKTAVSTWVISTELDSTAIITITEF